MDSTDARISIQGLTAAYDGSIVLSDVAIRIAAGEMVGVIGPNGSGKSTLLKLIGRLLTPEAGAVYLDGKALGELSTGEIARRMAVLPQAPASPSELTVRELVGYGRYPHVSWLKRFGIQDHDVIENTIASCHLEGLSERRLATLSGGERQKAWIAMAMAQQPRVMLLDEPVTFLDLGHQLEVMDLIAELNREQGITVITVLHDLNLAARYCPRLVALKSGNVHSDGPAREVVREDVLREVFEIGAHVGEDPITGQPVCYPYRLDQDPLLSKCLYREMKRRAAEPQDSPALEGGG